MSIQSHPSSGRRLLLVAVALGAVLISPVASAQNGRGDGESGSANSTREEVYVYGPRIHVERSPLGSIEKVSMSRAVRYDDLDLRTMPGAHELRLRIRNVAQ